MVVRYAGTFLIGALSIWVAFISNLGSDLESLIPFLIVNVKMSGKYLEFAKDFFVAINGEWWRLLTPTIIHFGPLHLILNLICWWQFGSLLERYYGTFRFMSLVVLLAVCSNLAQFFTSGPLFGGVSAVIFGLIAFIFARGFRDLRFIQLEPDVYWFIMGWFLLCWTGILGNFANVAHSVGLLVGLILGFGLNGLFRLQKRKTV